MDIPSKEDFKDWAGHAIFSSRWVLYPVNVGLIAGLCVYITLFMAHVTHFVIHGPFDFENAMIELLGFVDAAMVANLIIMIVQGSHQIFIKKFHLPHPEDVPQYLDHIDSGILKVKVSLSISSITLVRLLKDFVDLEKLDWHLVKHRMVIHGVALVSSIVMAAIWRITHPTQPKEKESHVHA